MRFQINRLSSTIALLVISGVLFIMSSACSPSVKTPAETPTEVVIPSATPEPIPTATSAPSALILVSSPAYDAETQQAIEVVSQEAASTNSMVFEVRDTISIPDGQQNWKVVVLTSLPEDLERLLNSAPNTQFVVISDRDLPSVSNLSVVRVRNEYKSFLAGYLMELIAPDRRAAALLPSDTALGMALEETFKNGGYYYCGICNTYYSPYASFPLVTSLPASTDMGTWLYAADEMMKNYVYAMYIAPEIANGDLLYSLAMKGLILVGGNTPPAELRERWAGTIYLDIPTPLAELLQSVAAGQSGTVIDAPIQLKDVNPDLLSPGRQRLMESTAEDLYKGLIYPFTPPLE